MPALYVRAREKTVLAIALHDSTGL
jgi:hypothetical protein